mmetsp:Transcript_67989/g.148160  ORF Transcript_67989/g.148160 Transcript_67989/m.148160 type:complete len:505 (+) Transcript_67989:109-1623(+)
MAPWTNRMASNEEGGMALWEDPQGDHLYTVMGLHSCHGQPKKPMEWMKNMVRKIGIDNNTRLVAPCAPARDGGAGWGESYQWFPYREDDVDAPAWVELLPDAQWQMLRAQRRRLSELLTAELERLPANGKLLVFGVSQGATMAMDVLVHFRPGRQHLQKLAGFISKRGVVQPETFKDLVGSRPRWFKDLPVLALHGVEDEMVDFGRALRLYRQLARLGPAVQFLGVEGLRHSGEDCSEEEEAELFARKFLTGWAEPGLQKAIPIQHVRRLGSTRKRPHYSYDCDTANMGNTTSESTYQSWDNWRGYSSDHSTQTFESGGRQEISSDGEDAWNPRVEDGWGRSTGSSAWADWGSGGGAGSSSSRNHDNNQQGYDNNNNSNGNSNNNTNNLQNQQWWSNEYGHGHTWDSRQAWGSNRERTQEGSYHRYYYSSRSNHTQKASLRNNTNNSNKSIRPFSSNVLSKSWGRLTTKRLFIEMPWRRGLTVAVGAVADIFQTSPPTNIALEQ